MSQHTSTARTTRTTLTTLGAAGLLAAGLAVGGGGAGASTDAAHTPRGYHFGSDRLLQTQDFNDVGVLVDTETIAMHGGNGLDACLGEERISDVAGVDTPEVGAQWTGVRAKDELVTETVALAPGAPKAATYAKRLTRQLRSCQHEPAGHFHYGPARTMKIGRATATYFVAFDGDGTPTGASAVVRDGATFGVLSASQTTDPPLGVVRDLLRGALPRLA